jgi:hypothetical protein
MFAEESCYFDIWPSAQFLFAHSPRGHGASRLCPPYGLLIFYEVTGGEIVIHAVRHSARNPLDMPGTES